MLSCGCLTRRQPLELVLKTPPACGVFLCLKPLHFRSLLGRLGSHPVPLVSSRRLAASDHTRFPPFSVAARVLCGAFFAVLDFRLPVAAFEKHWQNCLILTAEKIPNKFGSKMYLLQRGSKIDLPMNQNEWMFSIHPCQNCSDSKRIRRIDSFLK